MRCTFAVLSLAFVSAVIASPLARSAGDAALMNRGHSVSILQERAPAPLASPSASEDGEDYEEEFENDYMVDFELVERSVRQAAQAEGLTKRDLEERANSHKYVHSIKCGHQRPANNKKCQHAISAKHLPKNGLAVCDARKGTCEVKCKPGYIPRNYMCHKSASKCGKQKCAKPPTNGLYVCAAKNAKLTKRTNTKPKKATQVCRLVCRKKLVPNSKGTKCLDLKNDPRNCGKQNNKCPHSYNGHGKRTCKSGTCTGTCKKGNHLRKTSKGQFYCTRK